MTFFLLCRTDDVEERTGDVVNGRSNRTAPSDVTGSQETERDGDDRGDGGRKQGHENGDEHGLQHIFDGLADL